MEIRGNFRISLFKKADMPSPQAADEVAKLEDHILSGTSLKCRWQLATEMYVGQKSGQA